MDEKQKVYDQLDAWGIPFDVVTHEAAYTIDMIDEMGVDEADEIAKNLFLRNDSGKQHYLVVIGKHKTADMKDIREKIHSTRLSFASEERLYRCMHLKKGSVSPLGLLNDAEGRVAVFFDADLKEQRRIGVHPNENTATVFLTPQDLFTVIEKSGHPLHFIEIKT